MKKLIAMAVIIGGFAFQAQNALAGNVQIWANKTPAWGSSSADHTYVCIANPAQCVAIKAQPQVATLSLTDMAMKQRQNAMLLAICSTEQTVFVINTATGFFSRQEKICPYP